MSVTLNINGEPATVEDGATILDACKLLGLDIPTLCYLDGCGRFASCMVCVVKDTASGRILPACSAPVQQGMQIDAKSEEITALRRDALELLLSEHVGDCDAPCERVCPAQLRIPRMLRALAAGDSGTAATIALAHTAEGSNPCDGCKQPCEKACRRRQHDDAVSIAMLVAYALAQKPMQVSPAPRPWERRFNSVIGLLQEGEMEVFLAEANPGPRVGNATELTDKEARQEAARCVHCDCRKADNCRLRDHADACGASQRSYKIEERQRVSRNLQHADLVYEPGKCIRCGLCVRLTEQEDLGLAFVGRGFDVRVDVPFSASLSEALTSTAARCVDACPTGALAFRKD